MTLTMMAFNEASKNKITSKRILKNIWIFPIFVELKYCLITMTNILNMAQTSEKSAYSLRGWEGGIS